MTSADPDRVERCAVVVLGGGPGGYEAAAHAASLGLETVAVDHGPLGGTCLNIGCIPSKALIHVADRFHAATDVADAAAMGIGLRPPLLDLSVTRGWSEAIVARLRGGVEGLLRGAGVTVVEGWATVLDGKTVRVDGPGGPRIVRGEHLVLATGSRPVALEALPFGGDVLSSTEALALDRLPTSLAVVGAGYIGLELGTALAKLGVPVTIIEAAPRILPRYDATLTRPIAQRLGALGVEVRVATMALAHEHGVLRVRDAAGVEEAIAADKVLVTVGRRPATDGWGLEALDLAMNGSAVAIDDRCRTSMSGVWAVGDLTGEPMLAHRASAQGRMVAELIAGRRRAWDAIVPEVCFTDPELVSVGDDPAAAAAGDGGCRPLVGAVPFSANGRALTLGRGDGLLRVVARTDDRVVVGLQAVGAGVSELSEAFVGVIECGATLDDLALIVGAHPTLGESLSAAAQRALLPRG